MEYRFYNKGIDVEKAIQLIKEFFEKRNFRVSISREKNSEATIVSKSPDDPLLPTIVIKVSLSSDFLSINFLTSDKLRDNLFWASITSIFGGGIFLLRMEKVKKKIDELERDFWKFIDSNFESSSLS